jgi:hypothetical protein
MLSESLQAAIRDEKPRETKTAAHGSLLRSTRPDSRECDRNFRL